MPFHDCIGHHTSIALLQAAVRHKRLAHAYLFHGEEAIGKRLVATRLTQALSCEYPPDTDGFDSCGTCRSCRQIESHTHPDFVIIEPDPEQASRQIKIEQVREIEHQIMYRPLIAERKICHRIRHELQDKRDIRRRVEDSIFLSLSSDEPLRQSPEFAALPSREPTPEFAAEVADTCDALLAAFPDDQCRQIALLKLENYTADEIAAKLGCARRTVQRRLLLIRRTWLDRAGIGADDLSQFDEERA